MSALSSTDLDDLIAAFLLALEQGQTPDPADWLARHPEHAAQLALFLADLGRFGGLLGLPLSAHFDLTTDYRDRDGPATPSPEDAAKRFGEYELLGVIGGGGMGTVYRARVAGTTLIVALKQIRAGDVSGIEASRRFREEIENAAGLRHPNIVPVYHVGECSGQQFYTMALVEGGSLDRHIPRLVNDPTASAVLMAKVARAVHHAHQRRVLHRDLKPSNILLDAGGEPLVADFGLAARLDEGGAATPAGPPAGSLPWMAPEALRGDPVLTTAVDVWALGVILYELLTGNRPFRGADVHAMRAAILEQEPAAPRVVKPQVPRDLDAICRRCLQKNPDNRYESPVAIALELERWLRDEPVRVRPAGKVERFTRWCRRNPGLAGGLLTLLCVLSAGTAAGVSYLRDQDAAVCQAVCQGNEYAAHHVANSVLRRLDDLSQPVLDAAPKLRDVCRRNDRIHAQNALQTAFVLPKQDSPFASVYLLDPNGEIVARLPDGKAAGNPQAVQRKNFRDRDYFKGVARHLSRKRDRDRIHVSQVFHSAHDNKDKVAISCPVVTTPDGPWVLAATITTGDTLGLINLHDQQHKAVLIAPRDPSAARKGDTAYVVLIHPAFDPDKGDAAVPLSYNEVPEPDGLPELDLATATGQPPFPADENYHDPVADYGHPEYGGRWLTGSARVGHTELVVQVQQRYDEAVAPHRSYFRRFLAWVGGALLVGVAGFLGLRLRTRRRSE
jgi:serine/threonine-protein kinase